MRSEDGRGREGHRPALLWQPSLLDTAAEDAPVTFDRAFARLSRCTLEDGAWVDHAPRWVTGADDLFALLLDEAPWEQRSRRMYDQTVAEPRMTARWRFDTDGSPLPVVTEMADVLSDRYGVRFTSVGCNLYRDGTDSVAWHGDRVARDLPEATIAIVSVGEPRPFKLRPKGGGASRSFLPGRGDLLVLGGSCQRTWEHAVPKIRRAGPRISIQFRHDYDT